MTFAAMMHPNIVQCYGWCRDPDHTAMMVLERCEGTVIDLVAHGRFRGALDKVKVLVHVARALLHLHGKRLVHRDVALRNVLVRGDDVCVLADFGLTRNLPPAYLDDHSEPPQAPDRWLAPEARSNQVFSLQTDMFMFGMLIYELFAGCEPHCGLTADEACTRIASAERPPGEAWPPEVAALMAQCLQVDPANRPSARDALQTLQKLERALSGATATPQAFFSPPLPMPSGTPPPMPPPLSSAGLASIARPPGAVTEVLGKMDGMAFHSAGSAGGPAGAGAPHWLLSAPQRPFSVQPPTWDSGSSGRLPAVSPFAALPSGPPPASPADTAGPQVCLSCGWRRGHGELRRAGAVQAS